MTTIAYRDGVIAADTGQSIGGCRCQGGVTKIVRAPDGTLGAAGGSAPYCEAFRKWVAGGCEEGSAPTAKEASDWLDRGAVFHVDGTIEVHEPGGAFTFTADYYALGSGREVAFGAMFAGASPETAVKAAMAHDAGTFGEVQVLRRHYTLGEIAA